MIQRTLVLLAAAGTLAASAAGVAQNPHLVEYRGDQGPGAGKQVVLLAGDHEYRGEETLPALARILARRKIIGACSSHGSKTGFSRGSFNIEGRGPQDADRLSCFSASRIFRRRRSNRPI